ncbi:MAG: glutamine-hydrolyzing carbamoyl-phosphate synthase small subunit [bacterium]|nr:glutamine-hydrolyzing carbamoyl-phosphate synthase small subunit [bacterium]
MNGHPRSSVIPADGSIPDLDKEIKMKGVLILEDGTCFEGNSIGVPGERTGELVFHTSVVGYQEIMTDPANSGKILILTYPLIGNYGTADKFFESRKAWVNGLLIREESRIMSNFQAEAPFQYFLKQQGLVCFSEMDTRSLTVKIREYGPLTGILSTKSNNKTVLLKKLRAALKSVGNDRIRNTSVKQITKIDTPGSVRKIAILDLGCSQNFIHQLKLLKNSIILLPYKTPAEKILSLKPDGLLLSNGPENDMAFPEISITVNRLLGRIPVLGIQTGHEIIGLALGGKLRRMKTGHHGGNYPVLSTGSFKGEITVQNHDFVVDENSLKKIKDVRITLRNLNDNTIEEMESRPLKFISTQYYPTGPESCEVNPVFKRFISLIGQKRGK